MNSEQRGKLAITGLIIYVGVLIYLTITTENPFVFWIGIGGLTFLGIQVIWKIMKGDFRP